ncbi:MAG: carboxylesterase family protein, partial [Lachnospiraceae bacterium]|nr:carboxylesterase family protein [Lachnospiraceae bacterium]
MKTNSEKKRSRGILWRILFFLLLLILFAVLELGKHTILGWILLVLVFAAFYVLRSTKLKEKNKGIRFLSWIALLILCGIVLWISWPPVRLIPAVQAKNPVKTDLIHVAQGDLTGVVTEDKEVEVFAGIPYAKPPVGDLRWKEPQPADAWEGILEADHFAPMSMQVQNLPIYNSLAQIIGYHDYQISLKDNYREPVSEDSLYLNIWRPAQKT